MIEGQSVDFSERPDCIQIVDSLWLEVYPFLGEIERNALDQSDKTAVLLWELLKKDTQLYGISFSDIDTS